MGEKGIKGSGLRTERTQEPTENTQVEQPELPPQEVFQTRTPLKIEDLTTPMPAVNRTPVQQQANDDLLSDALLISNASVAGMKAVERMQIARKLVHAGGTGTTEDVELVAKELGQFPLYVLERMLEEGITVSACRNSVVDYFPELKGVRPRGWAEGQTWDLVPGCARGTNVVIAVVGHDTPAGAHVPRTGEGHGSYNMVLHESAHALDHSKHRSTQAEFNNARSVDFTRLIPYEAQPGEAGKEETYAESAARFFGGDPGDAQKYPSLHAYWQGNPLH